VGEPTEPVDPEAASRPGQPLLCGIAGARLRELRDEDAHALHALLERNRPRLARWMRWARDQTEQDTLEFIRQARSRAAADDGLERAIVLDGRIAGVVGFPAVDWANRSTEIGYWLDEAHEGRGLMTAAVRGMVEHAFAAWELKRVQIRIDVENLPSRAVAERLGFQYEGILRQAYWVGDRYSDDAVYSMLCDDWPAAGARLDADR
jgi:ribosomal-protein-serine acetyltransferase